MRFTIFKRLTFGYVAIMLLVVFLGVYVSFKLNQFNRLAHAVAAMDETAIRPIEHLLDAIFSQVGFEKKYLISKDPDFLRQFLELEGRVMKSLEGLEVFAGTDAKSVVLKQSKALYMSYMAAAKEEISLFNSDSAYSKTEYRNKKENIVAEMNQKLRDIIQIARFDRDEKIRTSSDLSYHVFKVASLTAGLAILVGLIVSFYNTRSINRSILKLQEKTKEIAKGKFEEIRDVASPPEIRELAEDFNNMCSRLRELDEMKADFISHVSHELRTPLTAIKEASSMLIEGTYKNTPEKEHELLAITKEECERLIASVNRILDLSRMEAKMMDYQFEECHIAPLLRKTILKLAPIALRKGIVLEFEPQSKIPHVKGIDIGRIAQVLEDLIGNALKFTNSGGRVVIKTALDESEQGAILVSVSDTGCGFPKDDLEKIFHRFKRIDSGRQSVRGTGLGLSLAKHIVAAHGGKIWAQSEPGRGSTFFFTLPVS